MLNSYARKDGERWKLREEDLALARREEMNKIFGIRNPGRVVELSITKKTSN